MYAPTVNNTRQNCGIATEKLVFKCNSSISAATTNFHQQNPCMTNGIIFVLEAVVWRCSVETFDLQLRPTALLKKRLWHRCFPGNFAKSLRTPFI